MLMPVIVVSRAMFRAETTLDTGVNFAPKPKAKQWLLPSRIREQTIHLYVLPSRLRSIPRVAQLATG
jgi:hypothetical protein